MDGGADFSLRRASARLPQAGSRYSPPVRSALMITLSAFGELICQRRVALLLRLGRALQRGCNLPGDFLVLRRLRQL